MLFLTRIAVVATLASVAISAPNPVIVVKELEVTVCPQTENIVPWNANYGTGVIPSGLETCLGAQLGPTFLNHFYNQSGSEVGATSCWGCLATVAKELPCIATAIATGDPSKLIMCGLGKSDICGCLSCLPDFAFRYVKPWCESRSEEGVAATTELLNDQFVSEADVNTKAFLGTLSVPELEALKDSTGNGTLLGGPNLPCPAERCGSCSCCIGLCIFGGCGGICV